MRVTVVFVHGAWHGAWCFDRVASLLRSDGVPAIAIDLPGHGADPGPFSDLHGDAARVREVLDGLDGGFVLLGHSYGGAVITQAGTHPAVRHLVYLGALALDHGESCQVAGGEEAATISHEGRPDLGEAIIDHSDGTTTLRPDDVGPFFYSDCDDDTVAWATAHLGPHPMVTLGQQPSAVAWREKPSTYVVCAQDMAIHPGLQRILARRCTTSVEWPTSHSPFASRPDLVARLVTELVR
jgi:pimeloyl-ACP methyl ester carboxylesterase